MLLLASYPFGDKKPFGVQAFQRTFPEKAKNTNHLRALFFTYFAPNLFFTNLNNNATKFAQQQPSRASILLRFFAAFQNLGLMPGF